MPLTISAKRTFGLESHCIGLSPRVASINVLAPGIQPLTFELRRERLVLDLAAATDGDFDGARVADAALLAVDVGAREGRLRGVERGRVEARVVDARVVDGDERDGDRLAYLRQLAEAQVALVELAVADDGVEDFADDGVDVLGVGSRQASCGGLATVGEHHDGRLFELRL